MSAILERFLNKPTLKLQCFNDSIYSRRDRFVVMALSLTSIFLCWYNRKQKLKDHGEFESDLISAGED
ncbi:unnamed protein product [Ceratitis capitata]|uniref:(Mediterranean fruit fly) hypothetical protein n=1 Tax=Ceratitis capitata TaxID=7213 RepID=A0A811UCZ1_CERCA|nr:unnamed protein product [Ceratitis capitata]